MFWRKKGFHFGGVIDDEGRLEVEKTRLDKIEERLKQLECEHESFEFVDSKIRRVSEDIFAIGPYKKCKKCGKEISIMDRCEWLKQKHEQEKAIADATAKQLKECKEN